MGEETFHPDTRALLAYGRALAGANAPPKKGGADQVLERLFVIERRRDGRLPVRSFGAELVALFGADLRDHDLARFFLGPDLALLKTLIDACAAAGQPGIMRVLAETACGKQLGAEMLIAPLKVQGAACERYLAMFQSLGGEHFLDGRPIRFLRIGSLHPPLAKAPRGMRLVVVND
ncbi:MAG: PAS domain-containing protein [Vitreimonas sp.]